VNRSPNMDRLPAPVPGREAPDANLVALIGSQNMKEVLRLYVHSQSLRIPYYPIHEPVPIGSRASYLGKLLWDLNERFAGSPDPERELAGIGNDLYDQLFPQELKDLYWESLRNLKSIQIISDEQWIPWQLVKPYPKQRKGVVEVSDPFLGEKFNLSRWWTRQRNQSPVTGVSPMRVFVACNPDLKSTEYLTHAETEVDFLEALDDQGVEVQIADGVTGGFYGALEKGGFAVLHVIAHGECDLDHPERCDIWLSDGHIPARMIKAERAAFGVQCALVFLNTCSAAQSGDHYAMTGTDGFVPAFLQAGAKAVLCTTWNISAALAPTFAHEFYKKLLEGNTVGEAFQSARNSIKNSADPTWLSYTFFGDPFGRISTPAG
jgi:hypothetical protein